MFELLLILFVFALVAGSLKSGIGLKGIYYRALSKDMDKWRKQGWVSEEGAQAILAENRPQALGTRLVFFVGLMGALLLLFAALSFIAANWQGMSRLSRLTLLLAGLWIPLVAGWRLAGKGHPLLAEAAYALGIGMFGVNIVFIAQMYHINSHPPDGILLWIIGAFVVSVLLQSRAGLALALVGTTTWSLMEISAYGNILHWPFLVPWAVAVALSIRWRWWPGYHLTVLSLSLWGITMLVNYGHHANWSHSGVITAIAMLWLLMLACAILVQGDRKSIDAGGFETWLERYAITALMSSLFILQMTSGAGAKWGRFGSHSYSSGWLPIALAALVLALALLGLSLQKKLLSTKDFMVICALGLLPLLFAALPLMVSIPLATYDFMATWVYSGAFLLVMIWLMTFGHKRMIETHIWLAVLGFGAQVLYVYIHIFSSLLNTSLFFFAGGLVTLALAFFLYSINQRLDDATEKEAS